MTSGRKFPCPFSFRHQDDHYNSHETEYRTAVDDMLKKALVTFCHRSQLYDLNMAGDQEYKIAHSDHDESREPGSLIEDQRRNMSHPPCMEPKGVLGQILFDVCVPKNVEGWDIKPTVSLNGRPTFASARQLGPFNPIRSNTNLLCSGQRWQHMDMMLFLNSQAFSDDVTRKLMTRSYFCGSYSICPAREPVDELYYPAREPVDELYEINNSPLADQIALVHECPVKAYQKNLILINQRFCRVFGTKNLGVSRLSYDQSRNFS
ncbi:unnamed protein product [Miscanthus lutarioriparius]|uniref:Uncharacterized protein n=1 Tax=Miscanthus lutarioriparius TaxID=422564 RepID=A0A811SRU0_9POAL|nr:unnamed protein product [Miscanthus lutarioriparius]